MEETLRKVGLGLEEIKIFLFLLKNGSSKATKISKNLDLARTTVYRFLESLKSKGFVSEIILENVRNYSPIDPREIPKMLKERLGEIEEIIPSLEDLKKNKKEGIAVELLKGREGIKSVMRDIIREGKEYRFIGEAEKYESEIDFFSYQWIREVKKKNMKGLLICSEDQKFFVAENEEYRLLKKELIPEISMWIYGNKTALFIWSDPIHAIKITSDSVNSGNKKSWEYFWSIAKKPSKGHLKKTLIKKI